MATSSSELGESSFSSSSRCREPVDVGCTRGSDGRYSHVKSSHDIFLSHSGIQKGFVKGLYERLHPLYSSFFDIQHHSLPPGSSFPPLIFDAAKTCRLAVLVLSHNFLKSRWPMLELHAFVNAKPQPIILPLFYDLSPDDLKHKGNLESWHTAWATFAAQDERIDVTAWKAALREVRVKNGLTFDAWEGQPAFIQRVVSCIFKILPPTLRHDFSGIQGKDRLSKILVAQFENLQRRLIPVQSGICVLGMYGPPGSGKSTLSRCLKDYYFPYFSGKALHLELPSDNPTDAQLLIKSKELFKLTDFMDRVDLDGASSILQVYQLLQNTNLQRSRVFLVVDNISSRRRTSELVEALLQMGFGAGSQVLLIARTPDDLQPLLQHCRRLQQHNYVCGCTCVPSLNIEEAIQVFLQRGGGVGLVESYLQEDNLTPEQRKDVEKVVRMSGFGRGHDHLLYLPLVLKIMGNELRRHNLDIKNWKRVMEKFWRQVHSYKKGALKELLSESFKHLSEKLQILYLDVALFILPSSLDGMSYGLSEACVVLSLIHDCSVDEIEIGLHELQGDCFLTLMDEYDESLRMHHVYMQFAATVQESCNYYRGSSRVKGQGSPFDTEDRFTANLGLRTVILEEHVGLEKVDFSSGFQSVTAMVLRNCKSLTALLGLAGLTSLVSLEVDNCPSLKWIECSAFSDLQKLKRIRWANMEMNVEMQKEDRNMIQWKETLRSTLSWMLGTISRQRPAPERSMMNVSCLASQLSGLQVLQLLDSGITQLPDVSQCWPLLRVLEIREKRLEHLQVCNLPNLESFLLSSLGRERSLDGNWGTRPRRRMIEGRNLFSGCPKLKQISVHSACLEGDWQLDRILECSELRSLGLKNFWHASELPNLAASANFLEELGAIDCRELSRVNFPDCRFENLTVVVIAYCPSLTEITGLEGLVSLRELEIGGCDKLQTLSGIIGLSSLCHLKIEKCTELPTLSGLSGLLSLKEFVVGKSCPSLVVPLPDLENLTRLTRIEYYESFPCLLPRVIFDVRNLVNLKYVSLRSTNIFDVVGVEYLGRLEELKLVCTGYEVSHGHTICHRSVSVDFGALLGMPMPSLYSGLSGLLSIEYLLLKGMENLTSLHGIEFLQSLKYLRLEHLQNLIFLQGVESLVNLRHLQVSWCSSVEEMPSLSLMVSLESIQCWHCVKLKGVEGCGALKSLRAAKFVECKSLACLPLGCETFRELPYLNSLEIQGSKFASTERLVAWIENKEVPRLLRESSLLAIQWEFFDTFMVQEPEQEEKERSMERIKLAMTMFEVGAKCFDDGEYFNLCRWADLLPTVWDEVHMRITGTFPASALQEVLRGEGKLPKQQLCQKCYSDGAFQLLVLNALAHMHRLFFVYVYQYILKF